MNLLQKLSFINPAFVTEMSKEGMVLAYKILTVDHGSFLNKYKTNVSGNGNNVVCSPYSAGGLLVSKLLS